MKKSILLLFCISFMVLKAEAQYTALPSDSAMFVYNIAVHSPIFSSYLIVKIHGDTILDNKSYSKVYYSYGLDTAFSSHSSIPHCYIRIDTIGRAWVRYPMAFNNDTSDVLIYDFSQEVSDTFLMPLFHPVFIEHYCDTGRLFAVQDVFIDSQAYNFVIPYAKQINYKSEEYLCPRIGGLFEFVEFIGCTNFIFYNELDFCTGCNTDLSYDSIHDSNLICFWYKGKWNKNGACHLWDYNVKDAGDLAPLFNIYPNPVDENLFIKFTSGTFSNFSLMSIDGRLLLESSVLPGETEVEISTSAFLPGVYIGCFSTNDKTVKCCKIIINK